MYIIKKLISRNEDVLERRSRDRTRDRAALLILIETERKREERERKREIEKQRHVHSAPIKSLGMAMSEDRQIQNVSVKTMPI